VKSKEHILRMRKTGLTYERVVTTRHKITRSPTSMLFSMYMYIYTLQDFQLEFLSIKLVALIKELA